MVYNEITKEVCIDNPETAKPNSSINHNTDEYNIHSAKLKQKIKIKYTEQEVSKAEIIKGVVENEEIIQELEVKSCEKGKTESKAEIIEVKHLVEKTATQKEYHSIIENIKKGVESKITCNKIAYNMTSKEQENGTRVQNIGETIEDKVPVETANIQTRTKQQYNDIVTKKHQITNNKKKQQVMDKGTK